MNGQNKTRTRQERIESLGIPKPKVIQWWIESDKADWALRIGIALFAAAGLLLICRAWEPRFAFRSGTIPIRDVIARVNFEVENEIETEAARLQSIRELPVFYRNRVSTLEQLRARLRNQLFVMMDADPLAEMSDEDREAFQEFTPAESVNPESADPEAPSLEEQYAALKAVLAVDQELEKLNTIFERLVRERFENGLLQTPKHEPEQGSQRYIRVYSADPSDAMIVTVSDV
ncbi:MAG: metal-dependent phosphohydrolase, partial [Planctomycetota bacterium]